ncbi:MAG: DUF2200 family protein [Candidatus Kapaibacteriota bacterium]
MKNIGCFICTIEHRRYLNTLMDELAKGKAIDKILRV